MTEQRRTWKLNRPMFNWRSRDPGNLTVDYSDGADHRWPKWVTCGPEQNGITLPSAGITTANVNAFALIPQASDTTVYWLYVAHGNNLAKLLWSAYALTEATNQPATVTERITDLLVTRTPSGARELSAFMLATAYAVYPTITATGATDTVSANNEAQIIRIAGIAPDRIIGFGGQKAYGNVLSATVTMDASAWTELAVYRDSDIIPTGFAMDQDMIVWGTNIGPLMLHDRFKQFFATLGKFPADIDNCRAMLATDIPSGVFLAVGNMLRSQRGGSGQRVGPERFGNPNPVQGKVTAIAANSDWVFTAHRNAATSTTYYLASKPGLDGSPDFYCFANRSDVCEAMDVPLQGPRARETLLAGLGINFLFFTIGNTPTWPDDASYTFQEDTDQTIYGTAFYPMEPERPTRMVFELETASATLTVAPGIRGTTETGQIFDATFAKWDRAGRHEWRIPPGIFGGERLTRYQPYFVLRTASNAATPKLIPEFDVWADDGR